PRRDGAPHKVAVIGPPDVPFPGTPDLWRPLVFTEANLSDRQRGAQWVGVLGPVEPGVERPPANAALAAAPDRLAKQFPRTNEGRLILATPLQERIVRDIRPAL